MNPLADMLNSLKLAAKTGKSSVVVPYSNLKNEVAKVLVSTGYLKAVNQLGKKNRKYLEFFLAYKDKMPKLSGLRHVSKPSRRVYRGTKSLTGVKSGRGLAIVSTPQGVMTDRAARAAKIGGEILAEVW